MLKTYETVIDGVSEVSIFNKSYDLTNNIKNQVDAPVDNFPYILEMAHGISL